MSGNYNAASRLFEIFAAVKEAPANTAAGRIWGEYFDIDEPDTRRHWMLVTEKLRLIYEELDLVERQMRATSLPPHTYGREIGALRFALEPGALHQPVRNYAQYITDHSLDILSICASQIPDEGDPINLGDLEEISGSLAVLRDQVESSDLPSEVKGFFLNHIRILQTAIADYRIRGPIVFAEARGAAMTVSALDREVLRPYKDEPKVRDWLQQLDTVWKWAERIEKVRKAIAGSEFFTDTVLPLASGLTDQL